ncbi:MULTISPECIES: FecR family protein [unclassified Sphingobacterium]|uniref:FecR family protein n=1 Tax=unclassified Sphingobacterium TaxID=2609468 RepID=UPI0010481A4F|nr:MULTISPECIES: FecR family protein [unclassified Sphingobacterium]MCS3556131.1 hypothetical protein [Sphingobacterium sp. JUb21]TCR08507.1 FecR family protein [Sphingobacterium sp. JUb20]
MKDKKDAYKLFNIYIRNEYNLHQLKEILDFFATDKSGKTLDELVDAYLDEETEDVQTDQATTRVISNTDKVISSTVNESKVEQPHIKKPYRLHVALASVLVASVLLILYVNREKHSIPQPSMNITNSSIKHNKATLALGNGQTIVLNEQEKGIIVNGADISYEDGRQEVVQLNSGIVSQLVLSTPAGGQYKITLPDGSRVWLNAASSITYPSSFTDSVRRVKLKGEAFFEVVKDTKHPLIVETDKQLVKVLGTTFNIKAYSEGDAQITTLITGSLYVKPLLSLNGKIISSGQQTIVVGAGLKTQKADINGILGWKTGEFIFHYTTLKEMLPELGRWYDLEVQVDDVPEAIFYAEISRSEKLMTVLSLLEETNKVKFKLDGKKLSVSKD